MQKGIFTKLYFSLLIIFATIGNLYSQSFNYELLGQYQAVSDTPDTIRFTSYLPSGFDFCYWQFDVPSVIHADHTYIITTTNDSVEVTMLYVPLGGSCINDPNLLYTRKVYTKQSLYRVGYDTELDSLASLKRVLRSAYDIQYNDFIELGDLRFFWNFDIKMVPAPNVAFDPNNPSQGHYPNVYYTFPNGGNYLIGLKVININSPLDTALHTKTITLTPNFGTDKIDFQNLPNVITPNGDNVNDYFEVVTSGTTKLSFKVFTRSGSLLYQHDASVIKWDGKNNYGKDLPAGIYFYILEDLDGKYNPAKGFFYIYR
jgi:gliding motility-associated-like protein